MISLPQITQRAPLMLSPYSNASGGGQFPAFGSATSGTYPTANKMFYYPFRLQHTVTVYKLWWLNGATASTNNLRVAVYAADGTNGKPLTRLILGNSVLASGANACQFDDITDASLGPGDYWMCIWGSGTTTTLFRQVLSQMRAIGTYSETNASGPQATATPVAPGASFFPLFGLMLRSSP